MQSKNCYYFKISQLSGSLLISLYLFFLVPGMAAAAADSSNHQTIFLEAVKALRMGENEEFRLLKHKATDDLLYPYLVFYDLRRRVKTTTDEEVALFIEKYADTPLSELMRSSWLSQLAKKQRWRSYLKFYKTRKNVTLQCHYLRARWLVYKDKEAIKTTLDKAKKLWLVGRTQPKACIPIFNQLEAHSRITTALLWQRIELAMLNGNIKLANYLAKKLNTRDRQWVDLWQRVHRNPEKGLRLKGMKDNTVMTRKIALHAIKKIARQNAETAKQLFATTSRKYAFKPSTLLETQRYIALRSAYQLRPVAERWLSEVEPSYVDERVRVWRARAALREQNWPSLKQAIQKMRRDEKQKNEWRYWLARSQAELREKTSANSEYKTLSKKTNYYGFLSADRIGVPYTFNTRSLERDELGITNIKALPGIRRAKALYDINHIVEARREWLFVIKDFDQSQLKLAALIAHEWMWHDNAILTIAKTPHRRDFTVRFPTPFREIINDYAKTYGIDASWIYGVARRESSFNKQARSSKAALGLMQLMPGTAKLQSKQLGIAQPSTSEIMTAEINLSLGSAYLRQMLTRFSGNQVLATAAYNAGPHRVDRWLPKERDVPADVWIDTMPYKETREYVRAVMAYSTIFNWKLKSSSVTSLKARMVAVNRP